MIVVVLLALRRALIADLGAKTAGPGGEFRTAGHVADAHLADRRTVNTVAGAIRHVFANTGICAMVTFDGAGLTGINAGAVFFVVM